MKYRKIWEFQQIRNEVDSDDEDLEREVKQKILDSISLEQGQLGSELVTILMKSVAQKEICLSTIAENYECCTICIYFERTWKTSVETIILEDALKNNSDAAIMGKCSQVPSLSRIGTIL